jgi:hypothetical protein
VKVKVFHAFGENEIATLEAKINGWLEQLPPRGEQVKHTNLTGTEKMVTASQITQPCAIVTIWYEKTLT